MALLDDVKLALRVTNMAFDNEIEDLIKAAQQDLVLAGVDENKVKNNEDPLIKRAIVVYCKANFGYDNPDAERFQKSYDLLKMHLALSLEYTS